MVLVHLMVWANWLQLEWQKVCLSSVKSLANSIVMIYGDNERLCIFQKDNAQPNTIIITKNLFRRNHINVLPRPGERGVPKTKDEMIYFFYYKNN